MNWMRYSDKIIAEQITKAWNKLKHQCEYLQNDLHFKDRHLSDDICTHPAKLCDGAAIHCNMGRCPKIMQK